MMLCIEMSPGCVFQAGIMEEMLEDTMEGFEDQDELEEEAQEEVDKVLFDLTAGKSSSTNNHVISYIWY